MSSPSYSPDAHSCLCLRLREKICCPQLWLWRMMNVVIQSRDWSSWLLWLIHMAAMMIPWCPSSHSGCSIDRSSTKFPDVSAIWVTEMGWRTCKYAYTSPRADTLGGCTHPVNIKLLGRLVDTSSPWLLPSGENLLKRCSGHHIHRSNSWLTMSSHVVRWRWGKNTCHREQ